MEGVTEDQTAAAKAEKVYGIVGEMRGDGGVYYSERLAKVTNNNAHYVFY